ncbi:MAG: xanthine dehydrogenase family protein molybdopterin-binding subunit, partial [Candidatus Hodarchaeota archaeon]
ICRAELAEAFQISISKVRIISPLQGGGFGGKGGLTAEPIAVALALKTNGKPVKLAYTREEEFVSTMVRHPTKIDIKTGVKKDGTLWARQVKGVWDTGAFAEKGPTVCSRGTLSASGPYRIPHLCLDGYCVYTNNPIAGAFRGFSAPQITWAYESQMDIIAAELKMDPLEIRLKNVFVSGDTSQTGQVLKAVGVKECLERTADRIGWFKRKKSENRGMGIACMHKWQGVYSSSALLKVDGDGSIILSVGTMEIGTGCNTILSQIVVEELGVPIENIKIAARDTDYTPYDTSTTASRSTFMMGNAVMRAAKDAKEQLLNLACHVMVSNRDTLVMEAGEVFARSAPNRRLTWSELAQKSLSSPQGPVIGRGVYVVSPKAFDIETGQGWAPPWMYAAQAAEVEVDTETGIVKVIRISAAHDIGKAINPSLCEGQIEGALITGLGASLWEEVLLKEGRFLNPNFRDYKLSTALDIPEIYPILVEESHEDGPYGAKGLGEPALAPTAAAIANAVCDAVGIRIKDLPLTPEKVLRALKGKK